MKLVKKLWEMCGTEKGTCQILCVLVTVITVVQFALDIVPQDFKEIIIAFNVVLWFCTYHVKDDN